MAIAPRPRYTGRGVESARVAAPRTLEDAAIVALACAGLRRSEIAGLCWQDVTAARWRGQWSRSAAFRSTGASRPSPSGPASPASRRTRGRRGMASELVRRGESTTAIQQAGTWRNPQMVARYASAIAVEHGAGRYLSDPAAGMMHLRPAIGNELPSHETVGFDRPLSAGREAVVRGIERLVHAAEQAGDVHAADVLNDAAARLRQASEST